MLGNTRQESPHNLSPGQPGSCHLGNKDNPWHLSGAPHGQAARRLFPNQDLSRKLVSGSHPKARGTSPSQGEVTLSPDGARYRVDVFRNILAIVQ